MSEKTLYVVTVSAGLDPYQQGEPSIESVFHVRASTPEKAIECAKKIYVEEYGSEPEDVENYWGFDTYELNDDTIIEVD
jgi:hypothetical protein